LNQNKERKTPQTKHPKKKKNKERCRKRKALNGLSIMRQKNTEKNTGWKKGISCEPRSAGSTRNKENSSIIFRDRGPKKKLFIIPSASRKGARTKKMPPMEVIDERKIHSRTLGGGEGEILNVGVYFHLSGTKESRKKGHRDEINKKYLKKITNLPTS